MPEKIDQVAAKAEVTFVVTNNHFESKAGVNALQLKHMLTAQRVKAPAVLLDHYPELRSIADPLSDSGELPLLA